MKLVIATGASGGHLYPALEVARTARDHGHEVLLLLGGTPRVPFRHRNLGFRVYRVAAGPIVGKGWRALWGGLRILAGTLETLGILAAHRFRPQAVVATGSFASVPGLLAAQLLRIPYFLLEQNVEPGATIRHFAGGAQTVFLSFGATREYLPADVPTVVTGNPVRRELRETRAEAAAARKALDLPPDRPVVLVLGGSQGSQILARHFAQVARSFPDAYFLIQAGRVYEDLISDYGELGENYRIVRYLEAREMALAYQAATLVVSRAGGGALAEITLFGVPALLVPFTGARGHQRLNAQVLVQQGAALLLEEAHLNLETTREQLHNLLAHPEKLRDMADRARSLALPEAAETIVKTIERWA